MKYRIFKHVSNTRAVMYGIEEFNDGKNMYEIIARIPVDIHSFVMNAEYRKDRLSMLEHDLNSSIPDFNQAHENNSKDEAATPGTKDRDSKGKT